MEQLEYDLYDCHIDNAMAAPGSLFAPQYWDEETTPTLELEMEDLFPAAHDRASDNTDITEKDELLSNDSKPEEDRSDSPVMLRSGQKGRKPQVVSMTSDMTASISSAMSDTTLVGDTMDTSCYYSGEEETMSIGINKDVREIMNLTHIAETQFIDD